MEIYEPREDSFLIKERIKDYAKGLVIDMGTGSGILAEEAAKYADKVIAADINKVAINCCKKTIKNKGITFVHSDLFKNIGKKVRVDLIIFNPPYLPYHELEPEDSKLITTGGKKGYEIIERLLSQASAHLKENGRILIVFSSLTKKNKVDEIIDKYLFSSKLLESKKIFFEELYVPLIEKSDLLKRFEKAGLKDIRKFSHGKRGIILKAQYKTKQAAVKIKKPESKAIGRIKNEIKFLKILNKRKIGPRLIKHNEDYLIYEFIDGIFIPEFLEKADNKQIKKVLKDVFGQMHLLDKLKINKEEMHHPYKHVIVNKNLKPILIDFERANHTSKPHNATQFCQYIISGNITGILTKKGFKINKNKVINLAKKYKKNINNNNFKNILKELSLA